MNKSRLITILAILALFALVGTATFVYLPGNVTLSPVNPPVEIRPGGNAGGADLAGNTITVTVGANKSSVSMTLHPTYQITYYHNVTVVKNIQPPNGDNYWFGINVSTPLNHPAIQAAWVKVFDSVGNFLFQADLTTAGLYGWPTALNDGQWVRIDVVIVIQEGQKLPAAPLTATFQIVYSPQNSVPPP